MTQRRNPLSLFVVAAIIAFGVTLYFNEYSLSALQETLLTLDLLQQLRTDGAATDDEHVNAGHMGKKVFILLLLVLSACAQYYTSSVRTDTVGTLCANFEDRTTLVDDT